MVPPFTVIKPSVRLPDTVEPLRNTLLLLLATPAVPLLAALLLVTVTEGNGFPATVPAENPVPALPLARLSAAIALRLPPPVIEKAKKPNPLPPLWIA